MSMEFGFGMTAAIGILSFSSSRKSSFPGARCVTTISLSGVHVSLLRVIFLKKAEWTVYVELACD